jgi:L-cysteine:1D-myo-inositol 2-amino-2-deoxy-alpha-D-glucopyranoside ligase
MILYNSLSRKLEDFVPIKGNNISLYVCGITPNNATHLGHAFTYVTFDTFIRFLKHKSYAVNYLQNATDINDSDDVIRQAKDTGTTWVEVAEKWIQHFQKQMTSLHVQPPTNYVLASSVIPEIIELVKILVDKKNAYISNGSVYYDVSSFPDYGTLCKYGVAQMITISATRGNNIEDPNKKNPLDFVLWVGSEDDPSWESPWGKGRPGWHIECSAMIKKYLGDQIDIHGGGRDLIFPHHESEIAQSESFTGRRPYVKYWMHVGMVMYDGEKMSKSLGNLVLVEDVLKDCEWHVLRLLLLSHHYRQPWEFIHEEIDEIKGRWNALITKISKEDAGDMKIIEKYLENDFDTPSALHYMESSCAGQTLKNALTLLGLN